MVNELALMVLIALVVRTASTARRAATMVAPASVVLVLWALPFIKPISTENALFAVLTVMVLRVLVVDARRAQCLDLARDLHDFVAHDVSGIVA